jgi:hypothetical protein
MAAEWPRLDPQGGSDSGVLSGSGTRLAGPHAVKVQMRVISSGRQALTRRTVGWFT